MTPDPILDELMAEVWADPDCPVTLAGPDSECPWGPPAPYPRTQVTVPAGRLSWSLRCGCRVRKSPSQIPVVELQSRVWVVNEPGHYRSVLVFLGQCQDCGRIYWGIGEPGKTS